MVTKKNGSKLVFFLDDGSTVQYDLKGNGSSGKVFQVSVKNWGGRK